MDMSFKMVNAEVLLFFTFRMILPIQQKSKLKFNAHTFKIRWYCDPNLHSIWNVVYAFLLINLK